MNTATTIDRPKAVRDLRDAISSMISDAPSRHATRYLVATCHRLAMAYLYKKVRRRRLPSQLFGLSVEDLALDCVAELFERDETGAFPVLRTYFEGNTPADQEEETLQIALRRLVFSKVNECLFRRYHEADPNLSRIIRNVKDAVKVLPGVCLVRHHHRQWLTLQAHNGQAATNGSADSPLTHDPRPLAPPEVLQSFFVGRLSQQDRVRELTAAFEDFTRVYPHYTPGYPLVGFAQVLRFAYIHIGETDAESAAGPPAFSQLDIARAIRLTTAALEREKHATYVGRGKVTADCYLAYFEAVRDILKHQYQESRETESYFSTLLLYLPDLEEDVYRDEHRNVLEYLVKLARARLLDYLSTDLDMDE